MIRIPVKSLDVRVANGAVRPPSEELSALPGRDETRSGRRWRFADRTGRMTVDLELHLPAGSVAVDQALDAGVLHVVIGDHTEPGVTDRKIPCSNAAVFDVDLVRGVTAAATSMTGLPPVFHARDSRFTSVSCPFWPGANLGSRDLDLDGIADTLRWGHPLDGRTLAADVHVVPADATAAVSATGNLAVSNPGTRPPSEALLELDPHEIVEEQMTALGTAARRLPVSNAFLSLSGGLDSRTALVALLREGRGVACATMAGTTSALDARLARRFCEACGVPHQIVQLGPEYLQRLPELALDAARSTGGLSSLSQTADLFFYSQVSGRPQVRISGNLGNQAGRGGVESLTPARPNPDVLSPDLRALLAQRPVEPWFIPRMASKQFGNVLFGQEVPYASSANYVVGSSCALQLTPFADTRIIELSKALFLKDPEFDAVSRDLLRRRDLRHRLTGHARDRSFLREFLIEHDRLGAHVPINWGWLARGGWSPAWSIAAATTAADAAMLRLARRSRGLGPSLRWVSARIRRPSALVAWPDVLRSRLRSLAYDVLQSPAVAHSGLTEPIALRRLLHQHFEQGVDHHSTIFALLEIGLGIHVRAMPLKAQGL